MPFPILPAGQINSYDHLFPNTPGEDEVALANRRFQREDGSEGVLHLLELIDKYQDGVVNAASEFISKTTEKHYNVPASISDELLLKLKTGGYCLGSGRVVRFSDKAKSLLKRHYLGTENSFKAQRTKKKII